MSDTPTPIRTDVPPAMHPEALANLADTLDQKDTLGANVWAVSRDALTLCYQQYGQLNDTERAVKEVHSEKRLVNGVPTQVAATSKELANAAEAAWKRVTPMVDQKVKQLTGTMTVLANRIAEACDAPARKTAEGIAVAGEVRNYIKAMPEAERTSFIANLIKEGDKQSVAAIVHAPAFLSGLTQLAHDNVKKQAAHRFAPLDAQQHAAAITALEYVQRAGSVLVGRYARAVNSMRQSPVEKAQEKLKALAGG